MRAGRKASRPDDLGTVDTERAAAVSRLTDAWEMQVDRIAAALDAKSIPNVADAFDPYAEAAWLDPILRANMQRLAETGAWDVLGLYNPTSDGWGPEQIEGWIAKAATTNAGRWSTAITDGLADAVTDTANAADRVRAFLSSNALAIALGTAFLAEATSFGGFDAATKSGLTHKSWRVTSKNPRSSHRALSGQTVEIRDVFSNGLRWPGDSFGTAADNANCSCRLDYSTGT